MNSGDAIPPTHTVPFDTKDHEFAKARVLLPLGIKCWRVICGAATRAGTPCRSHVGIECGSDRCHAHRGQPLPEPPFEVELVRRPAPWEADPPTKRPSGNVIPFRLPRPAKRRTNADPIRSDAEIANLPFDELSPIEQANHINALSGLSLRIRTLPPEERIGYRPPDTEGA